MGIDEVAAGGIQFRMQAEDVDGGAEGIDGGVARHEVVGGKVIGPEVSKGVDLHVKGSSAFDHFLTDAAEADDADFFLPQLMAGGALPSAGPGGIGGGQQVAHGGEQQAEGMFGHGGVIDARGEEDGQGELLRGGLVDFVQADAVFADDLQAREGFFHDGAADGIIAAEEAVESAGEFEHPGFGQWAAFPDDLESLGFQKGVVGSGGVLKGRGGEETAYGHGWLWMKG